MTRKGGLEKLKSKTQIDLVFKKGKAVRSGALVMHFVHPKEEVKKNPYRGGSIQKVCTAGLPTQSYKEAN